MRQHIQDSQRRHFGLDLMRALAILLVLVAHGTALLVGVMPDTSRLLLLYIGGYVGVELFFALSGFLIVGGLLRQLAQRPVLSRRDVITFWQRRWWRTLPNYGVFLLLNVTLFAAWFNAPVADARYLLFVQNLAWPHPNAMAEAWSLAVEEWFYLLLPLLLVLSLKGLPQPRHAVPLLLVLWVVLGTVARFGIAYWTAPEWDAGLRKIVLLRLDAIAWGGLAACLVHYHAPVAKQTSYALYWAGVAGLLASTVWLTLGVLNHFQPVIAYTGLFTLTGLSVALCLPWAAYWRPAPAFYTRWVTGLSRISYSLYLVHFSFALPLMQLPNIVTMLGLPWRVGGYIIISIAAAYLAYWLIEKPALILRERLVGAHCHEPM